MTFQPLRVDVEELQRRVAQLDPFTPVWYARFKGGSSRIAKPFHASKDCGRYHAHARRAGRLAAQRAAGRGPCTLCWPQLLELAPLARPAAAAMALPSRRPEVLA